MRLKIPIACLAIVLSIFSSFNHLSAQQIQQSAIRQIQSLIREKESRTPAQKKMDSQLLYGMKQDRGVAITPEVPTMELNINKDQQGRVPVDIKANVTREVIKFITELGGQVIFSSTTFHSITAKIPLQALERVAALQDVQFIYPADRGYTHNPPTTLTNDDPNKTPLPKRPLIPFRMTPAEKKLDFATRAARVRQQLNNVLSSPDFLHHPIGSVTSQGDVTHKADLARTFFGTDGTGVKIGVLSNGVATLANSQASGNLGTVTVLPGQAGTGDEGTAMLEIVHDLAPGAQLFFATAFTSQASFAQNILDLRTAGCDIIVDDVAYFREAVFQDDNVAQAVNTVTASGALYFSSAGNEGNKDDNASGVWEGDFLDAGTGTVGTVVIAGGTVHDFGGGVLNDQITAANGGAPIGLFWSDPLGASGNDYDLYILDAGLTTVVNAATNIQSGTQDPVELSTVSPAAGRRMVIFKKTGAAARALHLNTFRGRLSNSTAGQTHGHSAAIAAFSVAATPAAGPIGAPPNPTGPFPGPHSTSNVTEIFSSDGPRRIFYNPGGTAITPGNFLFGTNGGSLLQKPDITAADGVVTSVPGFNPFFGTSAAAPHAAAIAALIKSKLPALTPAQIRTALTSSALDIEAPGVDRDAGAGIIMAYEALAAGGATGAASIVSAGATLVAESCTPANSAIDPGEIVTVSFCVQNIGGLNTTNLVGTLQATGGITVPSGPQNYGVVVTAGPAVCRNFTFTASGACGSTITASIQLQDGATNLGTLTYSFTLGSASNTTTSFSNATAITIPTSGAATPYPSNITVSGMTGLVSKVTVTLTGLNHAFPEDVAMLLVGPGGQKFVIMDGVIGSTPWANINYTLDDAAATTIPKPGVPASGTFKPTAYFSGDVFPPPAPGGPNQEPAPVATATFASVFNGTNPNGTWSLYINDFAAGDGGNITGGWSLNVTTTAYTCCTPPPCTLTCPANITVSNDPNQCGAVVNYPAPTTSGTCGTVTATPASGSFFPVGTTTVNVTSTAGPTCSFTITVNDTQAPAVTCPANLTVSNTPGLCSAVVNYTAATATDNCPGVTVVSSPASGSVFPVGTTTVTATATDAAGNTATCTFTVRVNDTQAPAVTCPANITVSNTPGLCSAVVSYAAVTATDNCPGVTVVSSPASGSVFPVGTTTVTATATDASGNTSTCTFTVRVNDTQNPTFSSPGLFPERLYYKFDGTGTTVPNLATAPPAGTATANLIGLTQGGSGKCGGALIGTGTANQSLNTNWATNMTGSWTISFWLGPNQVDINPSYLFGDINAGAFRCFYGGAALTNNVLLRGGSGDVLITGVNPAATFITIVYNGVNTVVYKNGGSPQTYAVTFANVGAGPFRVGGYSTSASISGALDEFGMYTRALTPAEVLSLFNTCPASVNSCPSNITVNNTPGTCGAAVTYPTPVATDNCPGVITTQISGLASGSIFPVGTTTNTFRATDASGNIANCTFTVTVNDVQAPTITCPGNITVNTPIGSCTAVVPYTVTSTDNCPGVTQALLSGLASSATYPMGVTTNTWRATDASGNTATCTFTVTVLDGQLPVISAQPANRTVCLGTNTSINITVSNAVTYQWQQWNGSAWVNVTGGTAASLPLNNVTLAMNTNTYRVIVNGLCTSVTSNAATLYVNNLPTVSLTTTKANLLPNEHTNIVANVKPTGGSFVWFHNGTVIPGASGSALNNLSIDDIGTYKVVYTDLNGCVMTSADLVIDGQSSDNLYVMPNPNNGQFQVRFYATSTGTPLTLTVFASNGSKVYQRHLTSAQPYSGIDVDLGASAGGTYIVEVRDTNGKRIAAKRIVVRPN